MLRTGAVVDGCSNRACARMCQGTILLFHRKLCFYRFGSFPPTLSKKPGRKPRRFLRSFRIRQIQLFFSPVSFQRRTSCALPPVPPDPCSFVWDDALHTARKKNGVVFQSLRTVHSDKLGNWECCECCTCCSAGSRVRCRACCVRHVLIHLVFICRHCFLKLRQALKFPRLFLKKSRRLPDPVPAFRLRVPGSCRCPLLSPAVILPPTASARHSLLTTHRIPFRGEYNELPHINPFSPAVRYPLPDGAKSPCIYGFCAYARRNAENEISASGSIWRDR